MRSLRVLCLRVLGSHPPSDELQTATVPSDLWSELGAAAAAHDLSVCVDNAGVIIGGRSPHLVMFGYHNHVVGKYKGKILYECVSGCTYAFTHSYALNKLSRWIDPCVLSCLRDVDIGIICLMCDRYDLRDHHCLILLRSVERILGISVPGRSLETSSVIDYTPTDLQDGSYVAKMTNCAECMRTTGFIFPWKPLVVGNVSVYVGPFCFDHLMAPPPVDIDSVAAVVVSRYRC